MESLLSRISAGDPTAVPKCIDQYGNLVWSIARRLSPSSEDAEDAVQEVFIEIWKSAERFDPERSSEKTFIAMIARRRLIDRLRRSKRRPELTPMPETTEFANDQYRQIERGAEASLAARALAELKPEQRRVLELSIYRGMSHGEIVDATQMPLGTVKSHIRRGLNLIRERLEITDEAGGGVSA